MKKIFLLTVILIGLFYTKGNAQIMNINECGTIAPTTEQEKIINQEILRLKNKNLNGTQALTNLTLVPIKAHIVRRTNSTGSISEDVLNDALANMNRIYTSMNLGFYFCSGFNYIDNDNLYNCEVNTDNSILIANNVNNAINIYFVGNLTSGGSQLNGISAFPVNGNASENRIIISNFATGNSTTLPHEMGHFWNLIHTFGNTFNELVTRGSGANCSTAGDMLCDTPADIIDSNGGALYDQCNCVYTGTLTDANNQLYTPDLTNLMSYYTTCRTQFTNGQYDRMSTGYALRLNLFQQSGQYSYSCSPTIVSSPTLSANYKSSLGIVLTWIDASNNETGFLIERATSASGPFQYIGGVGSNTTSYVDFLISNNTTYYYRIKPSNSNLYSNVFNITSLTAQNYCRPSSKSVIAVGINGITFNNQVLSSNTGNSTKNGYGLYNQVIPNVSSGQSYNFVTDLYFLNTAYTAGLSIFLDLDRDGIFSTAEKLFASSALINASVTSSFTIPSTVTSGQVRMRIRCIYGVNSLTACSNQCYGETEDYIINVCSSIPPIVSIAPNTICVGSSANLTATGCENGVITWSNGAGIGSSVFVSPNVGSYNYTATCDVNGCSSTISSATALSVNPLPAQPSAFTAAPPTVCQGQNGVIYTVPSVAGVTYTWTYSGSGVPTTGTNNSITLNFASTATSGTLSVVANNACGASIARTIPITVNQPPTASLSGTQTIIAGQSADLSVSLTGTSPWAVVVGGTTYSSITASPHIISVTPSITSTYALTSVSNACGTITVTNNNTATVTVSPQTITANITGTTFCAGATVAGTYTTTGTFNAGNTFTAQLSDASGSFTSPVSLGAVSGGTISVIVPANTVAGTGYRIRVVSSNPVINGSANTANLTINVPATASLSGTQTIIAGQTANLSVNLTGTSPWTVVVSGNTTSITTTPFTLQVSPTVGITTYTLTNVTNICGATTVSTNNTATVTVNPQTVTTSITGTTFCAGTTITGTYTTVGTFNAGNAFTAQLSDALGSFTSPVNLGAVSGGTISVTIPANTPAGTGYRIRVVSSNPVINGTANTANLTINPVPVQPGAFINPISVVCQGQSTVIYSVPMVAGATSYLWTYTIGTGTNFSSTTNTVSVNFLASATSGSLNVIAVNACGNSVARTLAITVDTPPTTPTSNQSGNWNALSTWKCGVVPTIALDAIISAGNTITIDGVSVEIRKLVNNGGILNFLNNGSLKLNP